MTFEQKLELFNSMTPEQRAAFEAEQEFKHSQVNEAYADNSDAQYKAAAEFAAMVAEYEAQHYTQDIIDEFEALRQGLLEG